MQPVLPPNAQRSSVAGAIGRTIVTLVVFAVVFLAFLVAPLVVLALAALAFAVAVSRRERPGTDGAPAGSAHEFGAGAR